MMSCSHGAIDGVAVYAWAFTDEGVMRLYGEEGWKQVDLPKRCLSRKGRDEPCVRVDPYLGTTFAPFDIGCLIGYTVKHSPTRRAVTVGFNVLFGIHCLEESMLAEEHV